MNDLKSQLLQEAHARAGVMLTTKNREDFDRAFDEFWDKVEAHFRRPVASNGPQQSEPAGRPDEMCCDDSKWAGAINNIIAISTIRSGRQAYHGPPFRFCPWCGKPIQTK